MRKLTRIAIVAVAGTAAVACSLPNASAGTARTTDRRLPEIVAAAPPKGCQRREAYGNDRSFWSAVEGCLSTVGGGPAVKVESDCQHSDILLWNHVPCTVKGLYSVSKDGTVIDESAFSYESDPLFGKGTVRRYAYSRKGPGTYTLKITHLSTHYRDWYRAAYLPDITVVANGC